MPQKNEEPKLTPEAMRFLEFLAEISVKHAIEEAGRLARLEKEPKGFHLEGSCTCPICRQPVSGEKTWYDLHGSKCITCQSAIDKKIIPIRIIKNDKLYYTEFELDHYFTLTKKHINIWIKDKVLFARVIPSLTKGTHCRIFLLSDNKGFLPPKNKVESVNMQIEKDGKPEYLLGVPWYRVHENPKEHLAGYGIGKYVVYTPTEEQSPNE